MFIAILNPCLWRGCIIKGHTNGGRDQQGIRVNKNDKSKDSDFFSQIMNRSQSRMTDSLNR